MSRIAIRVAVAGLFWVGICTSTLVAARDYKSDATPKDAALSFKSGISAGLDYTDNARLSSSNEEDDWIVNSTIGASLSQTGGPLDADIASTLSYSDYINDTYGDQTYFDLDALVEWEQIVNRLTWQLSDFFTQGPVDSIDANTPNNTQNINILRFGPNIRFLANGRHTFTIQPVFQDYYYEKSDADNQQYGLGTGWYYQMYRTFNVGLTAAVTDVKYEDDFYSDYLRSNYGIVMSGTRPRSTYTLNLGMTKIDRDDLSDQHGASGSFDWFLTISQRSSLRTFIASDITDSSNDYYTSLADPGTGNFNNVQVSGDVLRSNTMTITYRNNKTVGGEDLDAELRLGFRDLDYKESPDDRKVLSITGSVDRRITPSISAGVFANYTKTKQTDISRTDKLYRLGGDVAIKLSRKVTANLKLGYQDKNSTNSTDEYSEFSVAAAVGYAFGR